MATTDFRYQGDAIVEERLTDASHAGVVVRSYLVDEAGSVVKLVVPAGEPDAGTYLVAWNGHGDALNLSRLNADGTLTLANSFSYSSWGAPTTATHNGIGNLAFRFLYVGQADVQWDDPFGLGLLYMHARHYAPALGRFLQPDPDGLDDNQYAYVADNPVTETDPGGTCFILCVILIPLAIGAVIDAVSYAATSDHPTVEGAAGEVAQGAVSSLLPWGKLGKAAKLVRAAGKLVSRVARAGRIASRLTTRFGQSSRINRLIGEASQVFPKKAARPDEWHHVQPKYLGGRVNGPQVKIPAAYHQRITNLFREKAPYGRPPLRASEVQRVMKEVYRQYPITGFPRRGI